MVSLLLALTSTQLKNLQEFNIELDKKKNILKCIGKDLALMNADAIFKEYESNISNIILKLNGDIAANIASENLESVPNKSTGEVKYFLNNIEYSLRYEFFRKLIWPKIVAAIRNNYWQTVCSNVSIN